MCFTSSHITPEENACWVWGQVGGNACLQGERCRGSGWGLSAPRCCVGVGLGSAGRRRLRQTWSLRLCPCRLSMDPEVGASGQGRGGHSGLGWILWLPSCSEVGVSAAAVSYRSSLLSNKQISSRWSARFQPARPASVLLTLGTGVHAGGKVEPRGRAARVGPLQRRFRRRPHRPRGQEWGLRATPPPPLQVSTGPPGLAPHRHPRRNRRFILFQRVYTLVEGHYHASQVECTWVPSCSGPSVARRAALKGASCMWWQGTAQGQSPLACGGGPGAAEPERLRPRGPPPAASLGAFLGGQVPKLRAGTGHW